LYQKKHQLRRKNRLIKSGAVEVGRKGLMLVLSGPSGAGKGAVCNVLQIDDPSLRLSVSATTRPPRNGEVNGVDYFFLDKEVFQKMIADGQLLEFAEVYNNYYGTPMRFVEEALEEGHDIILEIDIQGALQVKEKYPQAVLVFIATPSKFDLKKRLLSRGTDKQEVIEKRLQSVAGEMKMADRYDYIVINDVVSQAVDKIRSIITAEKSRPCYFRTFIDEFN
jgi:guanylate kinase